MSEFFIGEIKIVSFNFAPKSWALCNGQFLPIAQNQALFSLFGTMYGGNGQTTFALPDLRGRAPLHVGSAYVQGQAGGEETHTLTQNEMPTHMHFAGATTATGRAASPAGGVFAAARGHYAESGDVVLNPAAVSSYGGSQPHENMPPYLVLNFIVAIQGIFPSRN